MSVVLLAYHEIGCRGLRVLLRRGVKVSAVFTYENDPGENCWFGSVAAIAHDAGIPSFTTRDINAPEWVARIGALSPDVILSIYYRDIVKKPIRALPRFGSFNLHGSLLPKFRGRSPVNWQLVHGVKESGVTLHEMTGRADAGDIVGQERVAVGPDDTAMDLYGKLLPAAERVLERNLDALLAGRAPRTPQDESQASVFGGRGPEDGRIRWTAPRLAIHDLVRAVARPWPGAFCERGGERVMIWRSTHAVPPVKDRLRPGEVAVAGTRTFVGAGDGALEILEHETPAGRPLAAGELLN